jgi:hypothetical protein
MGAGTWTTSSFADYTVKTKAMSMDDFTSATNMSAQTVYKSRGLSKALNPYQVMRECCDSDEHPHTLPVILALDVTGSMGQASVKVAQKLNEIMTDLYSDADVPDIEFCIMGIGDLAYDVAPIQISQFESDIRIAEQLDEIFFEGGGGGNAFESYTAAWYMGVNHCKLDCWNRGQKGIIITLGDEMPNPHLPVNGRGNLGLKAVTGDTHLQGDVETASLMKEAQEKFDLYHISVNDEDSSYAWNNRNEQLDNAWRSLLGNDNYFIAGLNNLAATIVNIIKNHASGSYTSSNVVTW